MPGTCAVSVAGRAAQYGSAYSGRGLLEHCECRARWKRLGERVRAGLVDQVIPQPAQSTPGPCQRRVRVSHEALCLLLA